MPIQVTHISSPSDSSLGSVVADSGLTTSLFEGHLLNKKSEGPQLHITNFDFGVAAVLLFAFILFVWLYTNNSKRLNQIVKAFYVNRFSNQLGRDEITFGNRVSIFLSTLFILSFSLFIYQVANYYGIQANNNGAVFFIQLLLIISAIYGIKILLVRFFGFIFQSQKESGEYSMMIFLFCNVLGLFFLPIVVCMTFVKDVSPLIFIYSGYCVFALLLFIRLLRGFLIGLNSIRVSKFYLFLYLCTLEILPFVIMVKLFMLNIK